MQSHEVAEPLLCHGVVPVNLESWEALNHLSTDVELVAGMAATS